MRQLLHLLVLDRDRQLALTARQGLCWFLPIAACPSGTRVGIAVSRVLAGLQVAGDLLGQWNARLTADGRWVDSLVVVSPDRDALRRMTTHTWMAVDDLMASPALLDYQAWAVQRTFGERSLESVGPFETLSCVDEAVGWMRTAVGCGPSIASQFSARPDGKSCSARRRRPAVGTSRA